MHACAYAHTHTHTHTHTEAPAHTSIHTDYTKLNSYNLKQAAKGDEDSSAERTTWHGSIVVEKRNALRNE